MKIFFGIWIIILLVAIRVHHKLVSKRTPSPCDKNQCGQDF